jgi:glycosyltransferase involved in cell wall biosynthesis
MTSAGGLQRVAANLVRDLASYYETVLLSVEPLRDAVFQEPAITFRSLDLKRPYPPPRLTWPLELTAIGRRLRHWVSANGTDTVVAMWYDMASVAALAVPRSVRTIGCEHIAFAEAGTRMQRVRRFAYRMLDCAVSLTKEDLPHLAQICRRSVAIPNYVPTAQQALFEERERILLTVGHLLPRKGVDRLLRGLQPALLRNPSWKLVCIGGGEQGHVDSGFAIYLSHLIVLLGLQGQVEFHPSTSRIQDWYRRASIYVMGSRQEGLPMVLLEAKAHGLPSIAFDCPTGPKEIIRDGIDGFLIPDDSETYGEAAMQLIVDHELRRRMGDAALQDASDRFSASAVLPQWIRLIEDLHRA